MACGEACNSGTSQSGLVMAFMFTMILGLKRREQTREGNEIIRKEEREKSVR